VRPEDDYTHPIGPETNFNESMYVHFHDPAARLGGFVRLANRPREDRGEMTVCLYLPDGRVGFAHARPSVTSNDAFDAAGLRFEVREPMRRLDVTFAGPIRLLEDPSRMDDPKAALGAAPEVDCAISLDVRGLAPVFDHSFDTDHESFAPNHYEQLLSVRGEVRLDGSAGEPLAIAGHGLRDHSWGPRYWQTPWFYRWVHGCAEDFGFMGAWFGRQDGSAVRGGFVWDGGALHEVDVVDLATERDDRHEQTAVTVVLSGGGLKWTVRGRAQSTVPLRHRRSEDTGGPAVTRIVKSLMSWTLDDGRVLGGMSEYLDQIVDGRPVGLAV
jgi:hypothetical protein